MTGIDEADATALLEKFIKNGIITRLNKEQYRFVNKIPVQRGMFRLVEKPQKTIIKNKNILFFDAAEYFLMNYALHNLTLSTFKTYKSSIKFHLVQFFGKMELKNITQQHIKDFIELKLNEKVSPKNIRNCVTLLGTMFNKFVEWELISHSPYNGIINVKFQKEHNIRILNEAEIKAILEKAKNNSEILYQMILLTLYTGLKRSEIFALKKGDINFKNRKINVNKTLYSGRIIESRAKTAIRQVDVPECLILELKKAVKNKQDNDFIFYNQTLSYYTQDKRLRSTFANIVKSLKLDKLTFNALLHTYAYNALHQGMSIDYLHKQLGDYSIQATMDKYRDFIQVTYS
jgi:integrase